MTGFFSRVLVALVGLPLVLGMVWLGGWWLFGIVAAAAFVAAHEFVTMARSPGKPWEGFVVGSIAGLFVSFVALYQDRDHYLVIWQALVLGLVVVVAAAAGDLFESMLKRDLQVKDTGRLLGGHGGVLDRVDALLFASAAAFYLVLGFGYV